MNLNKMETQSQLFAIISMSGNRTRLYNFLRTGLSSKLHAQKVFCFESIGEVFSLEN